MKILRVDLATGKIASEPLPGDWLGLGGSALITRIINREVSPSCDPLGPENKLIVACGPLAATRAPQLGRVSIGAKSPLTQGIKEANAGGPAGQDLDRLGLRAIVFENAPPVEKTSCLYITKDKTELISAAPYRQMGNYALVQALQERFGKAISVISTGIAGERKYKGAAIALTDSYGDPSRNAARGGLGAVMGSKGLKAVVLDSTGSPPVSLAHPAAFREAVREWVDILKHDVGVNLFSRFGTPFAIANSAAHGTLPAKNYRSGRPENFVAVSGHAIQKILFERGGKMHGCMPGCVVQCSIVYPGPDGRKICSAYEYETIAMLGTNLGITDNDAIARLKFCCDDFGLDAIEMGSALGVAAEAGAFAWGDAEGAIRLFTEIEKETPLGLALASGVVTTARFFNIGRVPAYKGQAIPAHDPRAVKGTGVTYFTSPMGPDHTAGLTYRKPKDAKAQIENSLKSQILAAACDAFGYCLNSVPAKASLYPFFARLLNARYGSSLTEEDIFRIAKETLKEQLCFNESAPFKEIDPVIPRFFQEEKIAPTNHVFDVSQKDLAGFWEKLDIFQEESRVVEIRIPPLPEFHLGAGVVATMGGKVRSLNIRRALIVTDPFLAQSGKAQEVRDILQKSGIETVLFAEVEPDPPIELIEKAAAVYRQEGCDGLVGLGGGSSLDTAKVTGLRVTHAGDLREYESLLGGGGKIKPILPPLVCIPTTSGTGSEVNPCAVVTDRARDLKFILMSNALIPKLAVIDPLYCRTMPPRLTVESGVDALAHCIEGAVSLATPYHPYFEGMALQGIKLIGRSLVAAYQNPDDIQARTDMCWAAACGGLAFLKGLGLGHAITHALGAHYHIPHGRAAIFGLMAFVLANQKTCAGPFREMAFLLNRSDGLEEALRRLYQDLDLDFRLSSHGIKQDDLKAIAFYASRDAVNMATDPASPTRSRILEILTRLYG